MVVTGLVLYGLAPRGVSSSSISIFCEQCGKRVTIVRRELAPPDWIVLRYPGFNSGLVESNVSQARDPLEGFPVPRDRLEASEQSGDMQAPLDSDPRNANVRRNDSWTMV